MKNCDYWRIVLKRTMQSKHEMSLRYLSKDDRAPSSKRSPTRDTVKDPSARKLSARFETWIKKISNVRKHQAPKGKTRATRKFTGPTST